MICLFGEPTPLRGSCGVTVSWEIREGDSLEVMREMPDGSVDAIVTSPPYADQRAYEPGELGGNRIEFIGG